MNFISPSRYAKKMIGKTTVVKSIIIAIVTVFSVKLSNDPMMSRVVNRTMKYKVINDTYTLSFN